MKYCAYCGKELFDEAVVCPGCGCPVQAEEKTKPDKELDEVEIKKRKKKKIKIIIISVVAICVVVALFFASIPLVRSIKTKKIIKELSGETFEYNVVGTYSKEVENYTFDDEGNCKSYDYYYNVALDDPWELKYDWKYEIKFEKGETYVVIGSKIDKLKVKYDDDGEIIALYSTENRKTYERR